MFFIIVVVNVMKKLCVKFCLMMVKNKDVDIRSRYLEEFVDR